MYFSRYQLKSSNSVSVRKYVVVVVVVIVIAVAIVVVVTVVVIVVSVVVVVAFLETISESLGNSHTSHQVQETQARVTNLLFIVTTVPGVYTAHSIL